MPRERVEDLGRISVMIRSLIKEIEMLDKPYRPKDSEEWFESKSLEQKEHIIRSWCYAREDNLEKLYELLAIAEGTDELNDRNNSDS